MQLVIVETYHELLALNRALMEVRYLGDGIDGVTRGSALLSELHERVVDAIEQKMTESGDKRGLANAKAWRNLREHEDAIKGVLNYLLPYWLQFPDDESRSFALRNQLRPFNFSEEDIDWLMAELAQNCATSP